MPAPFPKATDWNNFWKRDETVPFTKVSWSKRRLMFLLNPYVRVGLRALDAGCGSGFFSRFFCDKGMDVTALDYSQEALDIASGLTSGQAEVVKDDLLQPGLAGRLRQCYDLVFTDGLLEHFVEEDQGRILKNLSSVLTPGGVIVTIVPNKFSPWELIRPFYMPGIEEEPFTLPRLLRLHHHVDLKVIASGGLNTFPFAFSPDRCLGRFFGMLLYTVAHR
jgi:SAM-dependent methyltransferase